MEGAPRVFLGMIHHLCSLGIEVDIEHDLKMIEFALDHRRFEAIHDDLASSFKLAVISPGKDGVHDSKEVREQLLIHAIARQVGMVGHEAIGIDINLISGLIFEEKVIIEALRPFGLEQPVFVMALPGDVEGGVVAEDGIPGAIGHAGNESKFIAKSKRTEN